MIRKGGQLETYSHGHCYGEVKKPAQRELITSNQLRYQVDFKNRAISSLQPVFEPLKMSWQQSTPNLRTKFP